MSILRRTGLVLAATLGATLVAAGAPKSDPADAAANALAHDIYKQLIEINTTDSVGNVTTAAEAMAERFRAAGFAPADITVAGPTDKKKNLVVRLRGSGQRRPLLLIGHLDVVEARREDWKSDPFQLQEKDGYFYGRGAEDMKDGDAVMVAALLRLKQEGWRPSRDIILALTADEEAGCCNGVDWLLKNRRELVAAEFVINPDGASIVIGRPVFNMGATEKVYADYQLVVTNRGGHSSEPRADNAIYQLAQALLKVQGYQFPFELNNVSRGYFERLARIADAERAADLRGVLAEPPDPRALAHLSANPRDNGILRTNCVATRLDGGHANNALPQRATANINCRILPGHSPEEVRRQLIRVIADEQVTVRYVTETGEVVDQAPDPKPYPPPPLMPEVLQPLEQLVSATWPQLAVIPYMDASASDGVYTAAAGMPTYGIAPFSVDEVRSHGLDERIPVKSFYTGNLFFYRYLKALTGK